MTKVCFAPREQATFFAYDHAVAKIFGGSASRLEVYTLFIAAVILIGGGIGGAIVVSNNYGPDTRHDTEVAQNAVVVTESTLSDQGRGPDQVSGWNSVPTESGSQSVTTVASTPGLTDEQAAWLRSQAQAAIDAENARLNSPTNIPGCGPGPYPNVPYQSSGIFTVDVNFDLSSPREPRVADMLVRALGIVMGTCNQYPFTGSAGSLELWTNPHGTPGYGLEHGGSTISMMALGVTKSQLDQALAILGFPPSVCERAGNYPCGITTDEELTRYRGH